MLGYLGGSVGISDDNIMLRLAVISLGYKVQPQMMCFRLVAHILHKAIPMVSRAVCVYKPF